MKVGLSLLASEESLLETKAPPQPRPRGNKNVLFFP